MRLLYLLGLLLTLPVAATAQSTVLTAAQVPLTGRRVADFVPPGWRIGAHLGGDLNADQRPDSVLMLVETPVVSGPIKDEDGLSSNRALVVLLVQPDGVFKRVGVGPAALHCDKCFPQLDYTKIGTPDLSVDRGEILVKHTTGSSQVLTQTQHYRFEKSTGRLRLVAEDYSRLDRPGRSSSAPLPIL